MQSLTTTSPQGETHWRVHPEAADMLLGAEGFRLAEWRNAGLLETVKTGPHRTVYRLQLPSGCFYLKHYRVGDWKAVLQNIVRPTRAVLEWRAAQRIADVGLSTIETVAVGRCVKHGVTLDSFLACRAIENTEALDTFVLKRLHEVDKPRREIIRRRLADEMGRMVGRLHRCGILHRDLHAENILVQLEADDTVRLWVIDLHAVTVGRRLTLRAMERNLALLNPALVHELTNHDRVRFFRSYWRALETDEAGHSKLPRQVSVASRQSLSHRFAEFCRRDLIRVECKRDRKWADGNRRLIIADAGPVRCRGVAQLGRELLTAIRDDPESLIDGEGAVAASGRSEFSAEGLMLPCGDRQLECRLERLERPLTGWWNRFRGGVCEVRHAWEMGHACLRRNVPTARPLAFVEQEIEGRSRQYLITETIPATVTLAVYLRETLNRLDPRRRDSKIAETTTVIAGELRHLHTEGLTYNAMDADSIVVRDNGVELQMWFACPRYFERLAANSQRQRVAALSDLLRSMYAAADLQLTQCLRFLKCYLAERFSAEWKSTWRAVEQRTDLSVLLTDNAVVRVQPARLKRSA